MIRVLGWLALVGGCADDTGPRLHSLMPSTASPGTLVDLVGERFCGSNGDCSNVAADVQLGTSSPFFAAPVVMWAENAAQVQVPADMPVGSTMLVMTVDGLASNALALDVVSP